MFSFANPILDPGSKILVTGVNGFVGSHIADKLLEAGYIVHGTTRNSSKNVWLQTLFDSKYGKERFNMHEVTDLTTLGALNEILKNTAGIIHSASDMSFQPDPNGIITPMVAATIAILKAASESPSVRRVVLTSSCAAAAGPQTDVYPTITSETWNDEAVKLAWEDGLAERPDGGFIVYAASKTACEKEAWAWYKSNTPSFVLNTVLPSMNMGKSLDVVNQGHASTSALIEALFKGNHEALKGAAEYFYIDVEDTARIHLAALLHQNLRSQRLFAYAKPYTWVSMQNVMRKLYPHKEFSSDLPDSVLDRSIIAEADRAEDLLKAMGRRGWTTIEDCMRNNTEDL